MKPLKQALRFKIAFGVLLACTVLILFTGPEFNFALQVILSAVLMFFLFWLVT